MVDKWERVGHSEKGEENNKYKLAVPEKCSLVLLFWPTRYGLDSLLYSGILGLGTDNPLILEKYKNKSQSHVYILDVTFGI